MAWRPACFSRNVYLASRAATEEVLFLYQPIAARRLILSFCCRTAADHMTQNPHETLIFARKFLLIGSSVTVVTVPSRLELFGIRVALAVGRCCLLLITLQ
jgi:hypothetical protein